VWNPHLVVAEPAVAIDGALSIGCSLGGCVPEFEDEDARDEEQRTADEEDLKDRHRRSVGATRDCGAVWAFLAGFMRVFFCDPHHPWQRGTNENTVSVGDGPVGLFSQADVDSSR